MTMPPTEVTCPQCNGEGQTGALVHGPQISGFRVLACSQCGGHGRISADAMQRYTKGRTMAKDRKSRFMTLRREAARLGISAIELSDLEWGRV